MLVWGEAFMAWQCRVLVCAAESRWLGQTLLSEWSWCILCHQHDLCVLSQPSFLLLEFALHHPNWLNLYHCNLSIP